MPARALRDPTLTGTDIRVLCAIGLHVGKDGGGCFASSRKLAEEAGVSRNKFFSAAKKLMAAGIITRESKTSTNGGPTCSHYAIVFNEQSEEGEDLLDVQGPSTENGTRPEQGVTSGSMRVRPSSRKRYAPSMNSPSNNPPNAVNGGVIDLDAEGRTLFSQLGEKRVEVRSPSKTTARGGNGTLQARELIKVVRDCRNPQFPGNLIPGSLDQFNPDERRVIKAFSSLILAESSSPGSEVGLVRQVADSLREAAIEHREPAMQSAG